MAVTLVSCLIKEIYKNSNHLSFAGGAKDEDAESGNGPSLPHSPHSVEGAIGGPKICSDSDFEDSRHPSFDYKYVCINHLICRYRKALD